LCAGAVVVALAGYFVWYGETQLHLYGVDNVMQRAGTIVRESTPENALVITSIQGQTTATVPNLLAIAERLVWSMGLERLIEPDVLAAYRRAGGTYWATLLNEPFPAHIVRRLGLPTPRIEYVGNGCWLSLFDLTATSPSAG
jgi:hypothetical protein